MTAEAGFSLIETLVASAVLSVSALALLTAAERHGQSVAAVTERTHARWLAEDRLTELSLGLTSQDVATMAGTDWRVLTEWSETSDADLARVEVSVRAMAAPETILARITGFVDRGARHGDR